MSVLDDESATRDAGEVTSTSSTTVHSPLEALERDEMLRTRRFAAIAISISLAGGASVFVLPGHPVAGTLLLCASASAVAALVFLRMRTTDAAQFRRPSTLLGWYVPAVAVTTAVPYFGVFSPAASLLVLGIYFTALGRSRTLALAVYLTCAGVQALLATAIITRALPDPGIVQITPLDVAYQWVVQALVQLVLLGTYVTGRLSRRTALLAVSELEQAVRLVAHREALLLEAREQLERALQQGRGRFSDQTIGGYHLGAVLGRGAMGEVYAATDADGNPVAIKLLSQASLANPHHVMRFFRELRTAAGLTAPNVVRVIEVGERPVPYLVMERLEGKTLADILRELTAMPLHDVLDLVRQVGAGITAAAAGGIVHRDLKPQNVFLHDRTWKILDFGVARAIDEGDTLTAGHVVGTPSYMAPEQASGEMVDHCTDLYALAAITYRALTGHPPHAAGELAETLYRVVHTRPRRPSALVALPPPIAPDIDAVLAIGLAKRPTDRFPSALAFADALSDAARGTLAESLRERAATLDAWAASRARPPTSRLRGPRR